MSVPAMATVMVSKRADSAAVESSGTVGPFTDVSKLRLMSSFRILAVQATVLDNSCGTMAFWEEIPQVLE